MLPKDSDVLYPITLTSDSDIQLVKTLASKDKPVYATTRLVSGAAQGKNYKEEDDSLLGSFFDSDDERDKTYMHDEAESDEEKEVVEVEGDSQVASEGGVDILDSEEADEEVKVDDNNGKHPTSDDQQKLQPELPDFKTSLQSEQFTEAVKSDETLKDTRILATEGVRGYKWEKGRIVHERLNRPFDTLVRLVVPKDYRERVMTVAHKVLGHLGLKKTLKEIARLFVWPGMTQDVKSYVEKCDKCLKYNKKGTVESTYV